MQPRQRDHDDRRPRGQDDRHTVRLDRALQPARGARTMPVSTRATSTSSTPSPTRSTPRGSTGDIDGAYVWNPNLAKLIAEGGTVLVTSDDLAAKGKTTYDLAIVTNEFAEAYPDSRADLGRPAEPQRSQLIKQRSGRGGRGGGGRAEHHARGGQRSSSSELIFLDAAEQVGPDYLGGGLAANLFAAAQFNQELGRDRDRAARGRLPAGSRRPTSPRRCSDHDRPRSSDPARGGRPGRCRSHRPGRAP